HLPQLVHERGEVAVTGAHHEGGDVVALEGDLDRIDHHLDVGGVLAGHAHPLGHLDQLDLVTGQGTPVLIEEGPDGVRAAHHGAAAHGERIGDQSVDEVRASQAVTAAESESVEIQDDDNA